MSILLSSYGNFYMVNFFINVEDLQIHYGHEETVKKLATIELFSNGRHKFPLSR